MARWRLKLLSLLGSVGFKEDRILILLSIFVGGATGVGAYLFFALLDWGYRASFDSEGFFSYGAYMLVILPMGGALVVGFITRYFAREAKGHGVPEVMDAMYRMGGVIRPRVSVAKAVSSALSIGTGGSAGTEGPIVQIGAAIGSSFGQLLGLKRHHMNTLIACGVAGGIAAIFDAPIAGVLFALEIFLQDFSFKTFSPIVFASVISTSFTHALRPDNIGIFEVASPEHYIFNGSELPFYLILGVFCAVFAILFIRVLYGIEDIAEMMRVPEAIKPVLGAALLGGLGVLSITWIDAGDVPAFYGNGYPLIREAIGPGLIQMSLWTLLLLAVLKILATSLTLGSGGSGGIFAPSLFVGACVGGAFGIALFKLGYIDEGSTSAYAIVGMAAVVAATTHAPLTAIVILYELTREPRVILPIMFAAIVATGIAQYLFRESIYTLKLTRRGVRVGRVADVTILKRIHVEHVPIVAAPIVRPEDPLQKVLEMASEAESPDFVVVDENDEFVGMVVADDIRTALLQPEAVPLLLVAELVRSGVSQVVPNETLDTVMDKFARSHVDSLPIIAIGEGEHIIGLITRQAVMDRYHEVLESIE